ncbi:galactose oxidase-like domain-containing protein [Cryptosporangium sp. NPDC051539]|uniref:galactose oxidase-like domain-containing protein n=1 Tax=Cryptosporangium sp. NPDC051539 TaxID=3363962 RepID=UPI0037A2FF5A
MSPRPRPRWSAKRRVLASFMSVVVLGAIGVVNRPLVAAAMDQVYEFQASRPGFQAQNGRWDFLKVPSAYRINAIHAALLPTGKVLLIAGSGNRDKVFAKGQFKTMLWDPATGHFKMIPTPVDMFCGGHSFLPDGKLVVAGGTQRYEVLPANVKRASGTMTVINENPNRRYVLGKGTVFTSKTTGLKYHSTQTAILKPGTKTVVGKKVTTAGTGTAVFVEALEEGQGKGVDSLQQFAITSSLKGQDAKDVHANAKNINYKKQEFQGIADSFEFNPYTEKYERVSDMVDARWYPTLAQQSDGTLLAVSGLNQVGGLVAETERYLPAQKKWVAEPKMTKQYPTYPALFLMKNDKLFFSGSSSGYGQPQSQRKPGIWDTKTNTFQEVPGLPDADKLETSASLLLAPAQDQKVMVLGGGKNGDSPVSTKRTAVIDLNQANPAYKRTADLPNPTRYLSAVLMPDDSVFTTNGSKDYRGRGESDLYTAQIYHPESDTFDPVARPRVGRNYHSEALLLPDGRVVTFGGDPLYKSKDDFSQGDFEQRIEIYTPPYLLNGSKRPTITDGPKTAKRGTTVHYSTPDAASVAKARLIKPSSVTHTTDVEQRSLALDLKKSGDGVDLTIPTGAALVPAGYYLLYLVNSDGTPSVAKWVNVS